MLKRPGPALYKRTRREITSIFGDARLVLDETPKAISPFGGQVGFAHEVQQRLAFAKPTSNNAFPLTKQLPLEWNSRQGLR